MDGNVTICKIRSHAVSSSSLRDLLWQSWICVRVSNKKTCVLLTKEMRPPIRTIRPKKTNTIFNPQSSHQSVSQSLRDGQYFVISLWWEYFKNIFDIFSPKNVNHNATTMPSSSIHTHEVGTRSFVSQTSVHLLDRISTHNEDTYYTERINILNLRTSQQ